MLRLITAMMAILLAGCGGGGSAGTFNTGVNVETGGIGGGTGGNGVDNTGSGTVEGTYQIVSVRDSEEQSGGREVFARDLVYNKTSYGSPNLRIFTASDPTFKDYTFGGSVKGSATLVVDGADKSAGFYASSLNQFPSDFSVYALPGTTSATGVASTSAILSVHTKKIVPPIAESQISTLTGTYALVSLDLDGSMLMAEYLLGQVHSGTSTGIATGSAYVSNVSSPSQFASTPVSDLYEIRADRFLFLDRTEPWPWHVTPQYNFLVTGKQKSGTSTGSGLTILAKVDSSHESACPQNIGTYHLVAWTVSVPSAQGSTVTTRLENQILREGRLEFINSTTNFYSVLDVQDAAYTCSRDSDFKHMMSFPQITNINGGLSDIRFFLTPSNQHLIGMELNRADGRVSMLLGFKEAGNP